MADLWPPSPDGRWRLAWNSFDVGGCDYPEALPESTELYVCAHGAVTLSDSMLLGTMPGSAFVKGVGLKFAVPAHIDSHLCESPETPTTPWRTAWVPYFTAALETR